MQIHVILNIFLLFVENRELFDIDAINSSYFYRKNATYRLDIYKDIKD